MATAKKTKIRRLVLDGICFVVGSFIFALSVNIFSAPNNIVASGVTGTSILLNYAFKLPIGVMVFVINFPLLIAAWKRLGLKFTLRTGIVITLMSIMLDVTALFVPAYNGNMILTVIFGGVLSGVGLGLIYMRGATTGGSEIIARLLESVLPQISAGRIIFAVDATVVVASGLVYKEVESAMYAIILIFVSSSVMDVLIYGKNKGKMFLVFAKDEEVLAKTIIAKIGRGVTLLNATGAYTAYERKVLLCAVRSNEVYELKTLVYDHDNQAFVIMTSADEIAGEGFRPDDPKKKNRGKEFLANNLKNKNV